MKKIFILILFWGLWFLNFSSRTILSPLLPVIEDEFTISHALAGGLFFFLSIGYATAVLLSGLLCVRIGHKRTIGLSFAVVITHPSFLTQFVTSAMSCFSISWTLLLS